MRPQEGILWSCLGLNRFASGVSPVRQDGGDGEECDDEDYGDRDRGDTVFRNLWNSDFFKQII